MQDLLARALGWAQHDPDELTRAEVLRLVDLATAGDRAAQDGLRERFAGPLEFGTAGLRAPVGAGESRMCRAVVIRATAGLVAYLRGLGIDAPVVAVGCDARHGSAEFADDVARVVSGAGGTALVLPPQLPTPVLARAVRAQGADAGVMVTASHNPAADNGYKVYLGGRAVDAAADPGGVGAQIVPPADAGIAAGIAAAPPADEVPRDAERVRCLGHDAVGEYVSLAAALRRGEASDLRIVLTAMHGVGAATAQTVLARAGFRHVRLVTEQAQPDPDFPTVSFPNPEEAGALDLALAAAQAEPTDLVIALDPDADRCSAAVPARDGGWRQLTGDEIGALLGEDAAARAAGTGGVLACSVVSGSLLARIAAAHGVRHATTLTGFKWIARTPGLVFGYEEAIGYCVDPESVRDKDGISAAVRVADVADRLHRAGRSVEDALDDLARAHGLHVTGQLSVRSEDAQAIRGAVARLLEEPPAALLGAPVTEVADLGEGYAGLPPTTGVLLRAEGGTRVVVRPSGTEPKLKCYLEVVVPVAGQEVPREQGRERLEGLRAEVARLVAW